MKKILFLAITLIMTTLVEAQKKEFTLEDLNFGGSNYRNMVPKNMRLIWWGNNLVMNENNVYSILNPASQNKTELFSVDDINDILKKNGEKETKSPSVTFPLADKSIASIKTSTKTYIIDFKTKTICDSYSTDEAIALEYHAKSGNLVFVKDDNLYIRPSRQEERCLTNDGSRDIVYGQSVHRNEFGIDGGLFWSNSGNKLAFYRMDQSMVTDYPLVDIDTRIATELPEKYPMAGMTSHEVTVGIVDIASGNVVYLNAGDPKDRYFTNIQWAPDDKIIYLIELNRDQTDMKLDAYDPVTGNKLSTLYTEHHDKYVHPMHPITFLPWDSDKFILQSEKDGYNHLYLFNAKDGKQIKQLTSGKWVVLDLVGFSKEKKSIIISSSEKSPIQQNTYSVTLNGKRTLLDNGRGWHTARLNADGNSFIDNYSEPEVPRNIDIVKMSNGNHTNIFSAEDPWKEYNTPIFTSGTIKAADGTTDLFYRMVKPADFNPDKKYPTIVYVYGGPGIRNVQASWHYLSRGWETHMAQKGYILFILDNRGSCSRGRDFEQATFRHLGVEEMKDQICGVEFLKSLPYVDADRMGVHGWSYGGFMTTSLMTTYPDVFKVGVAGGPVIDWSLYEVMYGERYMDTPETNPEGYKETSLLNKAANLKGKLQIITGMNDPVVVPQNSLSFLRECIKAGTQLDFFVYPGEPHNMRGRQSVHLHERITQYFEDYLK